MDLNAVLDDLNFGVVDSESEPDLDRRFVRTQDFEAFVDPQRWVILGPKGTGKSAIFELFTKFEPAARALSGKRLDSVLITAGTGLSDLSEVATGDIKALRDDDDTYDHEKLWNLYIAVRAAMGVANLKVKRGPLKQLLRALRKQRDWRVLTLLKELWELTLGDAPSQVSVTAGGATVMIRNGRQRLDVMALLDQVEKTLARSGKTLWILLTRSTNFGKQTSQNDSRL